MSHHHAIPILLPATCLAALLGASTVAHARPWKGCTPGKTTQAEVEQKFAKPSKKTAAEGKCSALWAYLEDQKIAGTTQAQFCFDAGGKLLDITVFPENAIDADTVKESYGENFKKRLTDDFVVFWAYDKDGMKIYFDKEGKLVKAILFMEPVAPKAAVEKVDPAAK